MHRESGTNCQVDPIVKLIWVKVGITKAITISITKAIPKSYHDQNAAAKEQK